MNSYRCGVGRFWVGGGRPPGGAEGHRGTQIEKVLFLRRIAHIGGDRFAVTAYPVGSACGIRNFAFPNQRRWKISSQRPTQPQRLCEFPAWNRERLRSTQTQLQRSILDFCSSPSAVFLRDGFSIGKLPTRVRQPRQSGDCGDVTDSPVQEM